MMRKAVTDLLKDDLKLTEAQSGAPDLAFVLGVIQAIEKRRLYVRLGQIAVMGLGVMAILGLVAPYADEIIRPLMPALPALIATAGGLCSLHTLRRQFR